MPAVIKSYFFSKLISKKSISNTFLNPNLLHSFIQSGLSFCYIKVIYFSFTNIAKVPPPPPISNKSYSFFKILK